MNTPFSYARLAGFVYLLLIVLYMGGMLLMSSIAGEGDFAARAHKIGASESLYRVGLALQVLTSVCTVILAYSLYAVLKGANERLAHMALCFRLGESFVGAVVMIISFATLSIHTSSMSGAGLHAEMWAGIAASAHFMGFNMACLFFAFGSISFFYIFLNSGYLPKVQSQFGIFASVLVVLTCFINFIVPQFGAMTQLGFIPMFISEIVTGSWMLMRGDRIFVQSALNTRLTPGSLGLTAERA